MDPVPNFENRVVISDIDIPFMRMVVIILKWMLASIPALFVMYAVLGIIMVVFMVIFGGGIAALSALGGSGTP